MQASSIFPHGCELYPILSFPLPKNRNIFDAFDQLAAAGVRIAQLRASDLAPEELESLADRLIHRARAVGARIVINNDSALAARVGADGVHVGQSDATVREARRLGLSIVGVSAHTTQQAREAEASGADYIGVGPIFASPTKTDRAPIGLGTLRNIRNAVHLPIVAIGGITPETARDCLRAGADAVSSISALFGAKDIRAQVHRFLSEMRAPIETCQ